MVISNNIYCLHVSEQFFNLYFQFGLFEAQMFDCEMQRPYSAVFTPGVKKTLVHRRHTRVGVTTEHLEQ